MEANICLLVWWVAVAFIAPSIVLSCGPTVARKFGWRARALYCLPAFVVLALCFTPVSLPGVIADHIAIGAAYIVLCLMISASNSRTIGKVLLGAVATITVVSLITPIGFGVGLILGNITQVPTRSIPLNNGRFARMQPAGMVTSGGTEISVSVQPFGLPLEFELGRRVFDDHQCEPDLLAANDEFTGGSTVITCDGTEIWRVK
jgi:hypothetical protein